MKSNTKTILALFAGAFAGAAIGIFFASSKGAKLRAQLSNMAEDAAESVKEKGKDALSDFKEKLYQKSKHPHNGNGHGKTHKQHS